MDGTIARDGRKCGPFSDKCEDLGVLFKFEDSGKDVYKIFNTESRIAEIAEKVERVTKVGTLSQTEARRLTDRLQFAETQLCGKTRMQQKACRARDPVLAVFS